MPIPDIQLPGVLAPVLTPFDDNLQPDAGQFIRLCRWLHAQGSGLAMFGTNSEGNSMSVGEKLFLLQEAVDAGIPAAAMLPGTGSCSLTDAVAMTRAAMSMGCGGVLVLPPFYYKGVQDEGLFRFFSELVERVSDERLRIYLYHIPPVAQTGFSPELIGRLLKRYPGVIAGIKDTGGDWEYTATILKEYAAEGFRIYAGTETILLKTMQHGGTGCISATANVNPAAIVALQRAWQAPEASAKQDELNALRAVFQSLPLIPAMKTALAHFSGDAGWRTVRPPLVPLTPDQVETLLAQLEARGFSINNF
jgi:4-hydroxy-tetrahydrodipicolinate synthase